MFYVINQFSLISFNFRTLGLYWSVLRNILTAVQRFIRKNKVGSECFSACWNSLVIIPKINHHTSYQILSEIIRFQLNVQTILFSINWKKQKKTQKMEKLAPFDLKFTAANLLLLH